MSAPDATEAEAPGSDAGDPFADLAAEAAAAGEDAEREIAADLARYAEAEAEFLAEADAGAEVVRAWAAAHNPVVLAGINGWLDDASLAIGAMCSRIRERAA